MEINRYLDSTYLKTPEQSGLSEEETLRTVFSLVDEAIANNIYAVMIRPDYVKRVQDYISNKQTDLKVGTVIGFHEGTYTTESKFAEAKKAIEDGADELDFVINYEVFSQGELDTVENEVVRCTQLCLENNKIAKWIIEIAALTDAQIAEITALLAHWIGENFSGKEDQVFVKSSTGFYVTEGGKPNGATFEGIKIMLDNAGKLPVKAAGGVRSPEDAEKMINLGVKRIGTSSALALIGKSARSADY